MPPVTWCGDSHNVADGSCMRRAEDQAQWHAVENEYAKVRKHSDDKFI